MYKKEKNYRHSKHSASLSENNPLYTNEEVADHLKISKRTLQKWRDEKKIAYIKINNVILYQKKHIDTFLQQNTRLPNNTSTDCVPAN